MAVGIYLDADFLISFLDCQESCFHIVQAVCKGNELIVPLEIDTEISRYKGRQRVKRRLDNLVKNHIVSIFEIDVTHIAATHKYMLQQKRPKCRKIDAGEAAAIALCISENGVLASNNMKDVAKYAEDYNLKHITTARVLNKAYEDGVINEETAERIWSEIISLDHKMPGNTFAEYQQRNEPWPL